MADGGSRAEMFLGDTRSQPDLDEKGFLRKAELRLNNLRRELSLETAPTDPEAKKRRDNDLRQLYIIEEQLSDGNYSAADLAAEPVRFSDAKIAARYREIITREQPKAETTESVAEAAPEALDNVVPFERGVKDTEARMHAAERRDMELEQYTSEMLTYGERLIAAARSRENFSGGDGKERFDFSALDTALQETPGEFAQEIRARFADPKYDDMPELVMKKVLLEQIESAGMRMSERLGVEYHDGKVKELQQLTAERLKIPKASSSDQLAA